MLTIIKTLSALRTRRNRTKIRPIMRAAFYISALLALVSLGLIGLNLYDFWYRPELPWREDDLSQVLATCMAGAFIFSVASLIFYRLSNASR